MFLSHWPRSLFRVFHKLWKKPKWTLWPAQYIILNFVFRTNISSWDWSSETLDKLPIKKPSLRIFSGFSGGSGGKESACQCRDAGSIPSWEDPLEKGMATHSSILAWRIPWTEDPSGLQSMRLQRVGHEWVTEHVCLMAPQHQTVTVYTRYLI